MEPEGRPDLPLVNGRREAIAEPRLCRFLREGEYWTIDYGGSVCRLRDTKGLRYLASLLDAPGTGIPVGTLAASGGAPARPAIGDARARDRLRVAVSRCIQSALDRIAAAHPELGLHLGATIRRGYTCRYLPDPRVPIRWMTAASPTGRRVE